MLVITGGKWARRSIKTPPRRSTRYTPQSARKALFDIVDVSSKTFLDLFSGSGIRIKIIDAMSTGRPVVARTVAVAGLKAVNGRDIAVADDANSFSDAVVKYLLDPALRSVTGKAASALVGTEYDNRTLTEQLYEFYKELTRGR